MVNNMGRIKVAIPTKGHDGLNDIISEVFGKANTFTIVEIENKEIVNVYVIDNPALSYKHGLGPVIVKTLVNINVNFVLTAEIGPGASELLNNHNIKVIRVKPGIKVAEAIRENILKFE